MNRMFSLDEIAGAVGGRVVARGVSDENTAFVGGVSKDTRTIKEGDLYVAIKGERFDGHDFCEDAVSRGASVILASDESKLPQKCIAVLVDDTVRALGDLARHYRFKINAKVVCVTGSVGKTTTREMVACALRSSFKVYSTKANENNEIGLPFTILSAPSDTDALVLELGMRLRGEISYLSKIACPDVAIITNVGYSHIERLGSREEIRLAKTEIIEGLTDNGILAVNADDSFLFDYVRNILPIGKGLAGVSVEMDVKTERLNCPMMVSAGNIRFDQGMKFDARCNLSGAIREEKDCRLKVSGVHNVKNALFALLVTDLLGGDVRKAKEALASYEEMSGRGKISYGTYTVINDAYNASPESMEAAFENLKLMNSRGRKIAVLGCVLELGDYAPSLHEYIGKSCGRCGFDHIFVTGDNRDDIVRGILSEDPGASYTLCEDTEDVEKKLRSFAEEGDTLLFKASHAFGFEALSGKFVTEV